MVRNDQRARDARLVSVLGHGYAGPLAAFVLLITSFGHSPVLGLVLLPLLLIVEGWNLVLSLAFAELALRRMGHESMGTPALIRLTDWVEARGRLGVRGRVLLIPVYVVELGAVVATVFSMD